MRSFQNKILHKIRILYLHLILFFAYEIVALLGILLISLPQGKLTVIWLSAGIAVYGLAKLGRLAFITILLGSSSINILLLINNSSHQSLSNHLITSILCGLAETIQYSIAANIFLNSGKAKMLESGKGTIRLFFFVSFIPSLLTSWTIIVFLKIGGYLNFNTSSEIFLRYIIILLSDTMGIYFALPFICSYKNFSINEFKTKEFKSILILSFLLVILTYISATQIPQLRYLVIPILLWMILIGKWKGVSVGMLFCSFFFIMNTVRGNGPFVDKSLEISFLTLISFILSMGLTLYFSTAAWVEVSKSKDRLKDIVNERTRELEELNLKLTQLAIHDDLTGMFNRREFLRLANLEQKRASRYKSPVSILLIDLDFFKQINDKYGHSTGDSALVHFSEICYNCIRSTDIPARIGGEEFAFLLPETHESGAIEVAERIRKGLFNSQLNIGKQSIQMSCSIGCKEWFPHKESLEDAIKKADDALYKAKEAGRNKTIVYREDLEGNLDF